MNVKTIVTLVVGLAGIWFGVGALVSSDFAAENSTMVATFAVMGGASQLIILFLSGVIRGAFKTALNNLHGQVTLVKALADDIDSHDEDTRRMLKRQLPNTVKAVVIWHRENEELLNKIKKEREHE